MPLLQPVYYISSITELTPEFLQKKGVRGLILDVDNTLTTHDDPVPHPEIAQWLEQMRQCGIAMMIVSNNKPGRVAPFAELLGLPFVANGKKPLAAGLHRAAVQMGLQPQELAVVGDQIFTDVLGGNLFGALSVMVLPLGPETVGFIRFKRKLEKLVLRGRRPAGLEET